MTDFQIPLLVKKVIQVFQEKGFEIYIIGGVVHDLIIGQKTYDWDFTTNARPGEMQKLFPESFYDNRFGTIGITVKHLIDQFKLKTYDFQKEGLNLEDVLEITTFRSEQGYSDRRHPDKVVWGTTLKEDLQRRDFTINSMALELSTIKQLNNLTIKLIDPYQGQDDLKNKLIRAVGDPNLRFCEDALRMIRAIRIASHLGFIIEEKTLAGIIKNAPLIKEISFERIKEELFKLIMSPFPSDGIKIMFSSGLLQYILPELIKTQGIKQAGHHTKDVWNHSLDSLASCSSLDPVIRFAALLHDIGKPIAFRNINNKITFYGHEVVGGRIVKNIADRLRFSAKEKEKLWLLVRYHMFAYDSKMTDSAIRRFIRRIGKENINNMISLRIADRQGGGSKATSWRLRELQERIGKLMYTPLQVSDLKIDGHDIMKELNLKPGPKIGKILNTLFEEVMEDASLNNKDYLLKRVKEINLK